MLSQKKRYLSLICRTTLYFVSVFIIFSGEYEAFIESIGHQHFPSDYIKKRLEKAFIRLARDEMGVIAMQTAFDGLKYEKLSSVNLTQSLDKLTSQITRRLRDYTHIVTSTRNTAVRLYKSHKDTPLTPRFDCCNLFERDLRLDPVYGCRVSRRKCCDLIPRSLPATAFNPGHNLTRRFQQQLDYWPNVKWFFFITADGLHTEYPAHNFQCAVVHQRDYIGDNQPGDISYFGSSGAGAISSGSSFPIQTGRINSRFHSLQEQQKQRANSFSSVTNPFHCHNLHQFRHRNAFIRSILPKPIWMTIILDQGEASQTQLLLGQRVAHILLASLSEKDYVNVLLVSDSVIHGLELNKSGHDNNNDYSSILKQLNFSMHKIQNNQSYVDLDDELKSNFQQNSQTVGYAYKATEEIKLYFDRFIHSVNRPLPIKTNHINAFHHAFQTIITNMKRFHSEVNQSNSIEIPEHIMVAYISRGYLTDLTEASTTLRLVSAYQAYLNNSVHICTYMPTEEKSTTVLFEQTFMKDLATRWSFYSLSNTSTIQLNKIFPPRQGHFFPINRTTDLSNTVGRFYEIFYKSSTTIISNYKTSTISSRGNILEPSVISSRTEDVTIEIEQDITGDKSKLSSESEQDNWGLRWRLSDNISQAFVDQDNLIDGGADSSVAFLIQTPDGYTLSHPALADTLSKAYHQQQQHLFLSRPTSYSSNKQRILLTRNHWNDRGVRRFDNMPNRSIHQSFFPSNDNNQLWVARGSGVSSSCLSNSRTNPYFSDSRQYHQQQSILNPDISQLEWIPGFQSLVRPRLLNEFSGEVGLLVKMTRSEMEVYGITGIMNACFNVTEITDDKLPLHIVYRWRRIQDLKAPYVVVVRSVQSLCSAYRQLSPIIPEFDFHYHRLDLLKEPQKCLFLNQLISFSFGTIYLSPRAFARPFTRLTQGYLEDINDVRHLVAYLFDHTVLISDPGLTASSPSIQSSVGIVERIGKFWMHRSHVSQLRDFIVRRYVVTNTGAMLIYPGTLLSHTYDPTNRIWYKRALALPGRLVATGPYLDDGGSGYIITLSRTIFEGNYTGVRRREKDKVAAVIGMDVTYRFLSFMLSHWLPECEALLKQENIFSSSSSLSTSSSSASNDNLNTLDKSVQHTDFRSDYDDGFGNNSNNNSDSNEHLRNPIQSRCLLMDDRGYLMAHPGFYDPKYGGPLEQNHLSYHEPIVSSDLLNNEHFLQKTICLNYNKRTLQRQYKFNLSITDSVKNSLSGEQCVEYQLWTIPETNLIFGFIKEHHRFGCSPRTGFCPCSTKNRLCLNCGRVEPRECECPCECPIELDHTYWLNNYSKGLPESIFYQSDGKFLKNSNLNHTVYSVSKQSELVEEIRTGNNISLVDGQFGKSAFRMIYAYPPCLQNLEMEPVSAVSFHFDPYIFSTSPSASSFYKINEFPPCPMNNDHFSSNEHIIIDRNRLQQQQQQVESVGEINVEYLDNADSNHQLNYAIDDNKNSNNRHSHEQPSSRCSHRTRLTCSSTVGCEWCMMTLGDEKPLDHPFCASISVCFNGVVGVPVPNSNYGLHGNEWPSSYNDRDELTSYTYAIRSRQESLELRKLSQLYNRIPSLPSRSDIPDSSSVGDGSFLSFSAPILHTYSSSSSSAGASASSHFSSNGPYRKVSHDLLALFSRHSEKMSGRRIIPSDFHRDWYNSLKLISSSSSSNNDDDHGEIIHQQRRYEHHSFIITNPVGSVIGAVLVSFVIFLLIVYTVKYRRRLRERFMHSCLFSLNSNHLSVLPPSTVESETEAARLNTSVHSHFDKYSSSGQQRPDSSDQCPRFNQSDSNNHQSQPPPPPPPTSALVCISNESGDGEGTGVNSCDEHPATCVGQSDTESTNHCSGNQQQVVNIGTIATTNQSPAASTTDIHGTPKISSINNYSESPALSPYWIVENCLEKVKCLMNTYEMRTINHQTMLGSELSKLHSELLLSKDRLIATNCTIPPNPYHTDSIVINTPTVTPVLTSTTDRCCSVMLSHQTNPMPYDQPSEFGDSAVGSDCATAASCASSSSSSNLKHVCPQKAFERDYLAKEQQHPYQAGGQETVHHHRLHHHLDITFKIIELHFQSINGYNFLIIR
ncbi:unnamed protein product [Heterobilharzia americana]|nr:unnamed protein product [Heterobilharzia americana]